MSSKYIIIKVLKQLTLSRHSFISNIERLSFVLKGKDENADVASFLIIKK